MLKYFLIIALSINSLWGISVDITAPRNTFHILQNDNNVSVKITQGFSAKINEPDIEYLKIPVLLPPGTKAKNIKISFCDAETLLDGVSITRTKGFPLDGNFYKYADSKNNIDNTGNSANPVSLAYTGNFMGYSYAMLDVHPITYSTDDSVLIWNKHIVADIELEDNCRIHPIVSTIWADRMRREIARDVFENFLKDFPLTVSISGASVLDKYPVSDEVISVVDLSGRRTFPPMPGDDPVDLLIITTDTLLPAAKEFLDETRNGFSTEFITLEQIISTYDGSDDAERMRRFIKDAYAYWGIISLVLVGDYTQLPIREIYELDIGGIWSNSPGDIYFAALDGDMNYNRDEHFGDSPEDDLAPDILFSRLQVRNSSEIQSFAQKHRRYRFQQPQEIFNNVLFVGSSIHSSCTDASGPNKKNSILENTALDTLFSVTRMYTNLPGTGGDILTNADNFVAALDSGYSIINHFDHGNQIFISLGMYCSGGGLTLSEIASLNNKYYPILYTFSCDVNRLDTDNIAKFWVVNPNGGGIAMFAHSNTAWSTQSYMDDKMWQVFCENHPHFTGEWLVDWLFELSGMPYDISILNLSGHSLTPVSSYPPEEFSISIDRDSVCYSDTVITLTFSPEPVHDYLITLSSASRILYRAYSDSAVNNVNFHIIDDDTLYLTVYTMPVRQFAIPVNRPSSPHIFPTGAQLSEVYADGDGVCEIGELVQVEIQFRNDGLSSGNDTFVINLPFVDFADTISINLSPAESTMYSSDYIPLVSLSDTLFGLSAIPVIIANAGGEVDTFELAVAGFSVKPEFFYYTDASDNIPAIGDTGTFSVVISCERYGNLFHSAAVFSSDRIDFLSDSVPLADMYSAELETVSIQGIVLDTTVEFSFTIQNLYFSRRWHLKFDYVPPPDTIWTEPNVGYISIYWNSASEIARYIVFRSDSSSGDFEVITAEPINNSYFIDYDIEPLTRYYYCVSAIDSFDNISLPSDTASGLSILPYLDGFPVSLPLGVWTVSSPVIFDSDGDGCKEIYVADESGYISGYHCDGTTILDTTSILLDSESQTLRGFWASLAAADIDDDGTVEIIAADRTNPCKIWAIDGYGNVEDGFPVILSDRILKDFAVEDLDGDGYYEIILFSEYRKLYIVEYDGGYYVGDDYLVDNLPECTSPFGASAPAVGDIDGDGSPEIIVGGGVDDSTNGYIYVWNADGTRKDGFPIVVPNIPWGSPVITNLDDDTTTLEFVIFIVNEGLYAFDCDGNILSGWPVPMIELGYCDGIRTPSVADFDEDGKSEIVFLTDEKLSVVKNDGTMWTGFPIDIGNVEWSAPVIADIDGDGELELICPNNTQIIAVEMSGEIKSDGYPLPCGMDIMSSPIVEDLDGDGLLEILVPAYNSKLYAWQTLSSADTSLMPWCTHRGNYRRTAVFKPAGTENVVDAKKPNNISMDIIPNPFNSTCRIFVSAPGQSSLEIYDLLGEKIRRWSISDGGHTILWNGEDDNNVKSPSGIYFAVLKSNEVKLTKRILFLK